MVRGRRRGKWPRWVRSRAEGRGSRKAAALPARVARPPARPPAGSPGPRSACATAPGTCAQQLCDHARPHLPPLMGPGDDARVRRGLVTPAAGRAPWRVVVTSAAWRRSRRRSPGAPWLRGRSAPRGAGGRGGTRGGPAGPEPSPRRTARLYGAACGRPSECSARSPPPPHPQCPRAGVPTRWGGRAPLGSQWVASSRAKLPFAAAAVRTACHAVPQFAVLEMVLVALGRVGCSED